MQPEGGSQASMQAAPPSPGKEKRDAAAAAAKKAAQEHDFKKAIRFIEKSLRLYPSDVAKLLLSEYKETYLNSNEQVESIKK